MIKISHIKSDNRRYNIERVLSLIKSEITSGLKNAKKIVVKPCCISDKVQLAATHIDALEPLLEFIRPYAKGQIVLAEGTSDGDTMEAFKNFGYLKIQDQYDLAIIDLNSDDYAEIEMIDRNGRPAKARVSETMLSADYIISISPPKTDGSTLFSGSIQNCVLGSIVRSATRLPLISLLRPKEYYKFLSGQQYDILSENIKRLAEILPIRLSVLDGFEVMEGEGPVEGELVPAHFAVASTNPVAADVVTAEILEIDPEKIRYLSMLGFEDQKRNYFVSGDDTQKSTQTVKLPNSFSNFIIPK